MRTGFFKNLDDFRATPVGRETQRSPTVFVRRVHVGSRFNQNRNDFRTTVARRRMQRSLTVFVRHVHVGPGFNQNRNDFRAIGFDRGM